MRESVQKVLTGKTRGKRRTLPRVSKKRGKKTKKEEKKRLRRWIDERLQRKGERSRTTPHLRRKEKLRLGLEWGQKERKWW